MTKEEAEKILKDFDSLPKDEMCTRGEVNQVVSAAICYTIFDVIQYIAENRQPSVTGMLLRMGKL